MSEGIGNCQESWKECTIGKEKQTVVFVTVDETLKVTERRGKVIPREHIRSRPRVSGSNRIHKFCMIKDTFVQ